MAATVNTITTIEVRVNPERVTLGMLGVEMQGDQLVLTAKSGSGRESAAAQIRNLLQRIEKELDGALAREK